MRLNQILTESEIAEYHHEWETFGDKYRPQTPFEVHSNIPVIGKTFRFQDKPLFRAHILKKRLRKSFDPYQISKKGYIHPNFHTTHYFICLEQLFHTSMNQLIPEYQRYIVIDVVDPNNPPNMKRPVSFRTGEISLDLVLDLTTGKNKFMVNASYNFYDDGANKVLQTWAGVCFGKLRPYAKLMREAQQGDFEASQALIRKIEDRAKRIYPHMIHPRKKIEVTSEDLIKQINNKKIFEEKLDDFFSLWDKP
jgi:hypothetical protein